jgi:hypothetical protein
VPAGVVGGGVLGDGGLGCEGHGGKGKGERRYSAKVGSHRLIAKQH